MAILILDELHGVAVLGQRIDGSLAVGQHQRIKQKAGLVFQRRVGLQHLVAVGLDCADMRPHKARHSAVIQQGFLQQFHRIRLHAWRHQHGHLAALDGAVARPGHQRQRGRFRDFGLGGMRQRSGHGLWQRVHAQPLGHLTRQRFRSVAQHGHGALANRWHGHLAQLKTKTCRDMRLLHRRLALIKQRGLGVMIGKLFGLAAHLGLLLSRLQPCRHGDKALSRAGLERAATAQRIRLIGDAAPVNGLPVHAVALVVVNLINGCVDGQFVKVWPAEPGDLRVDIRVNAASQQRVVGKINAGHDVRRAKRHLLGFGKKIVRVAVEHHAAHRLHRHQFFGNELGGIQNVKAELLGLLLGKNLQAQLPFWVNA